MFGFIASIIFLLFIINGTWTRCVVNRDNEMECSKSVDTLRLPLMSPSTGRSNKVTVATITGSKFESLNKEILKPLSSMEAVYFIGNTIENIEPDTFSQFTRLKELRFAQNKIATIDHWTEELKTVDVLIFEDNTIENRGHLGSVISRKVKNLVRLHLGNNAFRGLDWLQNNCPRLIDLNLPNNLIRTLPKNFSTRVQLLQYLDLQDNLLTSIDTTIFEGFSNLVDLRLTNNNITDIADSAFRDLSNLVSLTLRNNSITSITKDTLKGLRSLETISFSENRLDDISKDAFQHILDIKHLHINENTITSLEVGTFRNLNKLIDLDVRNNYITEFNAGMFENLPSVREIKLTRNDLEEIKTRTFVNLPNVELIEIAYNRITTIQNDAFESITFLKELNLMNNEISVWNSKAFKNVEKIGKINLEGNQIKTIQSQAFHNLNIKYIDFKDNLITKIEVDGFGGLDSLEYLGLSGNNIAELSEEIFKHLRNLKCIDFINNKVQKTELLKQLPKVQFVFTGSDETKMCFSKANL